MMLSRSSFDQLDPCHSVCASFDPPAAATHTHTALAASPATGATRTRRARCTDAASATRTGAKQQGKHEPSNREKKRERRRGHTILRRTKMAYGTKHAGPWLLPLPTQRRMHWCRLSGLLGVRDGTVPHKQAAVQPTHPARARSSFPFPIHVQQVTSFVISIVLRSLRGRRAHRSGRQSGA